MAVGKEILTKIRSVQNTQKITKAMQMVSTSKMRKTQERMRLARPYAEKVRMVMSHLAQTNTDHGIPLLESHREIRRVGFILITSDKGLCGGLNANVLKKFLAQVQEYRNQGIEEEIVCLGSKGLMACQSIGLNVVASAVNLGDTPKMEMLLGPLTELFQRYEKHEIDRIHLVYSGFVNTMRQEPRMEVLLPIGERDWRFSSQITVQLGIPLRTDCTCSVGISGSPLFRVCGLSGVERQYGIRTGSPHGCHESCNRQCRQCHQRVASGI